jgi:hypothetical protein
MKKHWRLLACLFVLPALPLLANEEPSSNTQETAAQYLGRKSCVQQPQKPQGQLPEEEAIKSQPVITPAVAPHVMDGSDTYVTLDFIWWKTFVGGMEYAFTGVVDNGYFVSPLGASTGKGHVQRPDFKFEPGLKVGIGVNFEHDGWDLYAQYTYLSGPSESNSIAAQTGVGATNLQTFYPNNGSDGLVGPLVSASCKWKQDFNIIDLELGRDYFISRYLTLRPTAGFKTGWINEQSTISLVPTPTVAVDGTSPNRPTSIVMTYRQNMWGLGIRTGLNAGWHATKNWSFYNDFAFTAMWSDFKIHQKQNTTESVLGSMENELTHQTLQTVIPVFEAGLGVAYITWWEQSRYRFEGRLGWEEQIWVDFNRFMTLGGTGSLTVQGLTAKVMLNF